MSLLKLIHNSILCIKYPWLYPRCYNGLHYNNGVILDKIKKYKNRIQNGNNLYKLHVKLLTFFHNYILAFLHCIPKYTILDFIPSGWKNRFANEIINAVTALQKKSIDSDLQIIDVKEKWGCLRISIICDNDEIEDYFDSLEERSSFVCINCGKDAEYYTKGWMLPYCGKCLPKDQYYTSIKEK